MDRKNEKTIVAIADEAVAQGKAVSLLQGRAHAHPRTASIIGCRRGPTNDSCPGLGTCRFPGRGPVRWSASGRTLDIQVTSRCPGPLTMGMPTKGASS